MDHHSGANQTDSYLDRGQPLFELINLSAYCLGASDEEGNRT